MSEEDEEEEESSLSEALGDVHVGEEVAMAARQLSKKQKALVSGPTLQLIEAQ